MNVSTSCKHIAVFNHHKYFVCILNRSAQHEQYDSRSQIACLSVREYMKALLLMHLPKNRRRSSLSIFSSRCALRNKVEGVLWAYPNELPLPIYRLYQPPVQEKWIPRSQTSSSQVVTTANECKARNCIIKIR